MSRSLSAFLALLVVSISFATSAADNQFVAPGVTYTHLTDKAGPWSIHITKFDLSHRGLRLTTTLAHGTVFGLATVPEQVAAMPKALGRPIAAVNGDFFLIKKEPYQGDPRGLQILEGELVSSPWHDVAFWMDSTGKPHMDRVKPNFKVTLPQSKTIDVGFNETRADDKATLLTPTLGPSTRTSNGVEVVLQSNSTSEWLPVHTGEKISAKVAEVHNSGNTALRPDTMVLSLGPKLAQRLPTLSTGDDVNITLSVTPDLTGIRTALGGGPALVRNGHNLHQLTSGKADHLRERNPRTAIGWNDHEFLMVVVDGRKPDLSVGMTFPELAALMVRLGCKEAMNLDGGGSTTMWLNGKVINHPSEKGVLRHVANTLVLLQSP
ncbi:MAG: phosphodiester glycosidase family protein [Limisphaerales bacterium]